MLYCMRLRWCQVYIILPSTPKLELWWNIGTGTPIKFVYGLTPRRNPIAAPGERQLDDMKYDPHHRITQHFFQLPRWVLRYLSSTSLWWRWYYNSWIICSHWLLLSNNLLNNNQHYIMILIRNKISLIGTLRNIKARL